MMNFVRKVPLTSGLPGGGGEGGRKGGVFGAIWWAPEKTYCRSSSRPTVGRIDDLQ